MKRLLLPLIAAFTLPTSINAESYYLYHGAWIQNSLKKVDRAELDGSIQIHSNLFNSLKDCELAGDKLDKEIFNKVILFESHWSCVKK